MISAPPVQWHQHIAQKEIKAVHAGMLCQAVQVCAAHTHGKPLTIICDRPSTIQLSLLWNSLMHTFWAGCEPLSGLVLGSLFRQIVIVLWRAGSAPFGSML